MMITKAIVRGIPDVNNNKYRVYIPLFRNANDSEIDATFEATLCFLNGVFYSLAVDDVVYVDFEDNYYEKPVIIGKLYTNKEDKKAIPTQLTVKTINVLDKAQFPSNTEIDSKSTSNFYKNIKDIQDDIWSLRKQLDDLKWINLDDPDQNAFYQAVNNLSNELEKSQNLINNLTEELVSTTAIANNAIQEANKTKQDLATTQSSLDKVSAELDNTVVALGEANSSLGEAQETISEANTKIDELESENEELKKRLSSAEEDIETNSKGISLKLDTSAFDTFKTGEFKAVFDETKKIPSLATRLDTTDSNLTNLNTNLTSSIATLNTSLLSTNQILSNKVDLSIYNGYINTNNSNISSLSSSVTTISQKVDKMNYYNHSISIIIQDYEKLTLVSLRANWVNTTSTSYGLNGLANDIWAHRDSNGKPPSIQASGVCQFGSEDTNFKGIIFALYFDPSNMELGVNYAPMVNLINNDYTTTWTVHSIEGMGNTTITDIVVPLTNNN